MKNRILGSILTTHKQALIAHMKEPFSLCLPSEWVDEYLSCLPDRFERDNFFNQTDPYAFGQIYGMKVTLAPWAAGTGGVLIAAWGNEKLPRTLEIELRSCPSLQSPVQSSTPVPLPCTEHGATTEVP